MKYRRLGRSGLKVSEIALGGWLTFDDPKAESRGQAIIDRAFELGINFYDTANVYAGGDCERQWGRVLQRYRRSSYVLATKVFFPMGEGPNDRGLSRKHIMEQCDASLDRLDTGYIDLYQCHRHDESVPLEETVRAMEDLVRQGKILYWGVSWWPAAPIQEAFDVKTSMAYLPISNQPKYNLVDRGIEPEVAPLCESLGVGQVVFSPLEQGILTGKYVPGTARPEGTRAANEEQNQFMLDLLGDDDLLRRITRLGPIAEEAGCTIGQLALAWLLHRPGVNSCITGATSMEQLEQNCAASGLSLHTGQMAAIEEIMGPAARYEHP